MPEVTAVHGCTSVIRGQNLYKDVLISREHKDVRSDVRNDPREHMEVRRDRDLQLPQGF